MGREWSGDGSRPSAPICPIVTVVLVSIPVLLIRTLWRRK